MLGPLRTQQSRRAWPQSAPGIVLLSVCHVRRVATRRRLTSSDRTGSERRVAECAGGLQCSRRRRSETLARESAAARLAATGLARLVPAQSKAKAACEARGRRVLCPLSDLQTSPAIVEELP